MSWFPGINKNSWLPQPDWRLSLLWCVFLLFLVRFRPNRWTRFFNWQIFAWLNSTLVPNSKHKIAHEPPFLQGIQCDFSHFLLLTVCNLDSLVSNPCICCDWTHLWRDWYRYVGDCASESRSCQTSGAFQHRGAAAAVTANRLAYSLGLRGESCAFDTACSSSLVALSHAHTKLRSTRTPCRGCVVMGVRVMLGPDGFVGLGAGAPGCTGVHRHPWIRYDSLGSWGHQIWSNLIHLHDGFSPNPVDDERFENWPCLTGSVIKLLTIRWLNGYYKRVTKPLLINHC